MNPLQRYAKAIQEYRRAETELDAAEKGLAEFQRLARGDKRAACGTEGGYYRHLRTTKTPSCESCKRAHRLAEAQRRAARIQTRRVRGPKDVIEDVEWLIESGENDRGTVAKRLGTTCAGLEKKLQRAGRNDLLKMLSGRAA